MTAQILNGLIVGSMYALIAIGFTLVLGVLDRLNFAHTEVFMFGAFAGLVAVDAGGIWWLALPFAFVVGGVFGIAVEFISFRRFEGDARITAALSSLAVGLVIVDVTQKVWGTEPVGMPIPGWVTTAGFELFGMRVVYVQLLILGVTLALMAALHALVSRTRMGRNIRAVADSPDAASLLGVDVRRVTQHVFVISSALAGVAGLLLAFRTGFANTDVGLTFGLKAIAIMAIGGMGDLRGAVVGGLLIGVLEALTFQFGIGKLGELVVWITMILVLFVRPEGLFGGGVHVKDVRA
jgi:branched-chain amino acid transport system permease protein